MDNKVFAASLAAILTDDYTDGDVRNVKEQLNCLNKQELSIKRKMEKDKNEFVKNKGRSKTELKAVRGDIKKLKNILKNT